MNAPVRSLLVEAEEARQLADRRLEAVLAVVESWPQDRVSAKRRRDIHAAIASAGQTVQEAS